jgi:butyrate kinase
MSARTEKKLEALENDVKIMEDKQRAMAERLRNKKTKTEETRNLVIVEIVRENNVSIGELKTIINNGGKLLGNNSVGQDALALVQTTQAVTSGIEKPEKIKTGKENEHEEIF